MAEDLGSGILSASFAWPVEGLEMIFQGFICRSRRKEEVIGTILGNFHGGCCNYLG